MKAISKFFLVNTVAGLFVLGAVQVGVTDEEGAVSEHHDAPPGVSVIDSMVNLYEAVTFDHEMHMDMTGCSTCHHHMSDEDANPYCYQCHKEWYPGAEDKRQCEDCHVANRYDAAYLEIIEHGDINHHDHRGLMGAFHNQCRPCHVENGIGGCQDCHARTEAGDKEFHVELGYDKKSKKDSGQGH